MILHRHGYNLNFYLLQDPVPFIKASLPPKLLFSFPMNGVDEINPAHDYDDNFN